MKVRTSKYETTNELTCDWFDQVRAKNLPISGTLIQEKAGEIAAANGHHEFIASIGWLESFKYRRKLTFSTVCGESKDGDPQPVNDFKEKLPELIAYCDESALFFRAIPRKNVAQKK